MTTYKLSLPKTKKKTLADALGGIIPARREKEEKKSKVVVPPDGGWQTKWICESCSKGVEQATHREGGEAWHTKKVGGAFMKEVACGPLKANSAWKKKGLATEEPAQSFPPAPQAPQEGATVTLEHRKSLPIFQAASDGTRAEVEKLNSVPKFSCSSCAIGPDCPEYRDGFVCAFNTAFSAFDTRNVDQVMELMQQIIGKNKVRLMRAYLSEELTSGGQLDQNVTRMSDVLLNQMKMMTDLSMEQRKVTVQVTGEKTGGVLSRLFGGAGPTNDTLTLNMPQDDQPTWAPEVETKGEEVPATPVEGDKIATPVATDATVSVS